MDGSQSKPTFLFVGNHSCLDFINTQIIVRGNLTDLLDTFDDLVAWLVQTEHLSKGEGDRMRSGLSLKEKEQALERARTFRATLRDLAEHIVRHKGVPRAAVTEINRLLSQRPGFPQIVQRGTKFEETVVSKAVNTDNLLTPLAQAASNLLCRGNLALIKKCANEACILYFYDTTKSHTRNWCSMQLCGNRIKVAAHYRRKKQEKGK
jgi:predicted RNA-binding Zn ribbon-like protein